MNKPEASTALITLDLQKKRLERILLKDWMVGRLNTVEHEGRKAMRATCKEALKGINKSDENCPIVLEQMSFNIFFHYMSTKNRKKSGSHSSATGYGRIRSALSHLYRMSGKEMEEG